MFWSAGMFVEKFYTKKGNTFSFSKQQASDFAKQIAGDFNPLHDPSNSRFCVPGDLLFSLILSQFGVSKLMTFDFKGMVGGNTPINFIESSNEINAKDAAQKTCLSVYREGEITQNPSFIEAFILAYVSFSGKTFPYILSDKMKEEGMMINPVKPMVIYDQMKFEFKQFADKDVEIILKSSSLEVNGKRGLMLMNFDLRAQGLSIGSGEKRIILGGLRPYEQSGIDLLEHFYNESKQAYSKAMT